MTRRSNARIAADNAKLDAELAAFWAELAERANQIEEDIERQNDDDFLEEQEAKLDAYYEDINLEDHNG